MTEKTSRFKFFFSILFRFLRVVAVLVVAIAVAKLLISLNVKPEKKQVAKIFPSVMVMVVNPVSKRMTVDAYGTVKPRKLVKISAEVPGRIEYLHPLFVEGGKIFAGDLLVRIDQRAYALNRQAEQIRIQQAKTQVDSLKQEMENLEKDMVLSRANVMLSQKELARIKALSQNQFASKTSLDKAEQQFLQAKIQLQTMANRLSLTRPLMAQKKAAVAMARVNFQKADLAFQNTRIRCEFDGLVLDKFAEQGEYVNPGQVLGSIYQIAKLDVEVSIPLEKMKWIEALFEEKKMPEATVMLAGSEGRTSQGWSARVARIKARIDEKTRTLPMTLEILDPEVKINGRFDLKPGTFVRCSIKGQWYENVFVLPRHLLKRGDTVFTVDKNRLTIKKVKVLRKFEDTVYIDAGLMPGDNIVSSPLPGAVDGMELMIKYNGK